MSDLQTFAPDTDYFMLGDGRLMAIIQWSRNPALSPLGLVLYEPERMSRKNGSLLFHPELGLARTMLGVTIAGERHQPRHDDLHISWDDSEEPAVIARWHAGDVEVVERFFIQTSTSTLVRDVTLVADGIEGDILAALYANPLLFDEFGVQQQCLLYAAGYTTISLFSVPTGRAFERFLTVRATPRPDRVSASFIYGIEAVGTHEFSLYPPGFSLPKIEVDATFDVAAQSHDQSPTIPEEECRRAERIADLYRTSCRSLRAAVSQLGKFDASIWQYDFEWGMDASMVATAASSAGMFALARQVLTNILRRLSSIDGMIAEASRFRGGEMSELNGNGAVLDAIWHYWRWSGDESLLHSHWKRIAAIADYPLREEFTHESGLLRSRRDFWERFPWMGVEEGFELGHQVYCAVGLGRAAEMAAALGYQEHAERWSSAARRIREAVTTHPTLSLVEEGALVHRRLLDGSVQWKMRPDRSYRDGDYGPYVPTSADTTLRPCEPDTSEALALVYGVIDPKGPVALRTMERLERLWSPTGEGGYARYNVESDPDSPGPWAFATAFMAAAELEAGLIDRGKRTIDWLIDAAGAGGTWFEYYGPRVSPPYPPIGIIVWGWAQFILLVTKHIVGVRVDHDAITIAPKLLGLHHRLLLTGHMIRLSVTGLGSARLDGAPIEMIDGTVSIPLPLAANHRLEFLP